MGSRVGSTFPRHYAQLFLFTAVPPCRPDRGAALAEAHELFKGMLQTLSVDDWGLFG